MPETVIVVGSLGASVDVALASLGCDVIGVHDAATASVVLGQRPGALLIIDGRGSENQGWALAAEAPTRAILQFSSADSERAWAGLGSVFADVIAEGASEEEWLARVRAVAAGVRRDQQRAMALSFLAHDLNNPLAAIRILGQVLQGEMQDSETQRDVADILEAVDAAGLFVEGFAAANRLERGAREVPFSSVDLGEVVARVVERPALHPYVIYKRPERAIELRGDAEALHQAVLDLVWTARRMTGENRRVRVICEEFTVRVFSQGPTLPDELRYRLLAPFQASLLRERQLPVPPFGLVFARWTAERHGGRVEVDPAPQGAEFRMVLNPG